MPLVSFQGRSSGSELVFFVILLFSLCSISFEFLTAYHCNIWLGVRWEFCTVDLLILGPLIICGFIVICCGCQIRKHSMIVCIVSSQLRLILFSGKHLLMFGDSFGCHRSGHVLLAYSGGEARVTVKYPTICRTTLYKKNYPAQNVSS